MQMLVKRARRGDAEAFVELMESCKSSMYRVAKGFFQCEDDTVIFQTNMRISGMRETMIFN